MAYPRTETLPRPETVLTAEPKLRAPVLIESTAQGLRRWSAARRRAGETIGMVPTMGALHDGHLTLVSELRKVVDRVVVSIFVNPTQFGPNEDYTSYPRTETEDLAKLSGLGVDVAYMPTPEVMYPQGFSTEISVGGPLTQTLDAVARPGHFTGVATVVSKLLIQAMPDVAAFGEKDYQQLQIIRRMVTDLNLPIEIMPVPTVRDAHGLALSSRNAYLTPEQLAVARQLNKILRQTGQRLRHGTPGPVACAAAEQALLDAGFSSIDYVAFADPDSLAPLETFEGRGRLLAAARLGKTRLIDNMAV